MSKQPRDIVPLRLKPTTAAGYKDPSDDHLKALKRALRQWNTVNIVLVELVTGDAPCDAVIMWAKSGTRKRATGVDGKPILHLSHRKSRSPLHLAHIAHEVGHALGLEHDNTRPGIMNSNLASSVAYVSMGDRTEARRSLRQKYNRQEK